MFCPKCSQQQASDEMRFCSRCGFPLAGVALLIENNGLIPGLDREPVRRVHPSRKKIMAESALFTVAMWAATLCATFWFDAGGPFEGVAKAAAVLFANLGLIGLIRFLYGFLFAKDVVGQSAPNAFAKAASAGAVLDSPNRSALPPQQSLPVSDYPQPVNRRANTKEMAPPRSVTENTTRLLDEPTANRAE